MSVSLGVKKVCVGVALSIVLLITLVVHCISLKRDGQVNNASKRALALYDALYAYSHDRNGVYPGEASDFTSNDALRPLFIGGYIHDDLIFTVSGSKWSSLSHPEIQERPNSGATPPFAGRNHWAYNKGFSQKSKTTSVLLCDGFCKGAIFRYSNSKADYGGVWLAKSFISISVSGALKIIPIPESEGGVVNVEGLADFGGGLMLNPAIGSALD